MMIFLAAIGVLLNISRYNSLHNHVPEKVEKKKPVQSAKGAKNERVRA